MKDGVIVFTAQHIMQKITGRDRRPQAIQFNSEFAHGSFNTHGWKQVIRQYFLHLAGAISARGLT
jgi:hypothetical protein